MLGGDSDIQLHVDIRGKALTDLCTGLHSQSISGNDDVDVGAKWNFRSATVSPEKNHFVFRDFSRCRHPMLQANWIWVLITVLFTLV